MPTLKSRVVLPADGVVCAYDMDKLLRLLPVLLLLLVALQRVKLEIEVLLRFPSVLMPIVFGFVKHLHWAGVPVHKRRG